MRRRITGFSNPAVKAIRALRDKKHRKREGRFIAEGLRLLTDAREAGLLPLQLVTLAGRECHPLLGQLEAETLASGGEILECDRDILAKITGKDNPQSVAGVFAEPDSTIAKLDRRSADIWLVAQSLRDPGNLGTMLRTADAVGAGGLILVDDCADPYSVEAVRASMGAIFTRKVAKARWPEFLAWLRAGEGQLVAAALEGSEDHALAGYAAPCFLLVGNESQGLPGEYVAACDLRVKIAMHDKADSLNAAMATAIIAYAIRSRLGPPL